MTPFTALTSVAAPLRLANLDTDQIIPARFLRHPRSPGYGNFLFHDLRFDSAGQERRDFILNRPPFRQARILVAGPNFGGGSSREGAVFALADFGIRCVIAPSFGQIFYKNCIGNGVLPARLAEDAIDRPLLYNMAASGKTPFL
ncbi:MAG: 3-isopropylmalate dehydratase small subunit, partial [Rhodobacteraceae bacterium]|nr:3-isopropylmalate dehydratase small subunit [Paracoccaceae bacterium]